MNYSWKQDIVEIAQAAMNDNKHTGSKGLLSALTNEVVALRAEIERLETKLIEGGKSVRSLVITFDIDGSVDTVESTRHE